MWFDSWFDIGRLLAVGAAAYLTLVVTLRLSGKRTLAKLNAFDFVVTIAIGSTLATILLDTTVSWSEGAAALVLLAALQFVVAWSTVRLPSAKSLLTARPTLLLREGIPRYDALRQQRVALDELRQAVRGVGAGDLHAVAAVVLETDGTLSVITTSQLGDGSALEGVRGTSLNQR
ncbi:MAG: DUF421 domain-containing protein [Actinomycetota bacterium]|nr:DUF421 domain-containing protein [Actinomycetota bacterium]